MSSTQHLAQAFRLLFPLLPPLLPLEQVPLELLLLLELLLDHLA
jgi:hypothetical protein